MAKAKINWSAGEQLTATEANAQGARINERIEVSNFFGDGSDGNVTINSATFSSGPITNNVLTRDAYFDDLTIEATRILDTAGFRIFVAGTLTNNGTIRHNGGDGQDGDISYVATGGPGASNGTLKGGSDGADGNPVSGNGGGGGGGAGGAILIFANTIDNNSIIQANGGDGGDAAAPGSSGVNSPGIAGDEQDQGAGGAGGAGGAAGSTLGGASGTLVSAKINISDPFMARNLYDFMENAGVGGGSGGGSGGRRSGNDAGGGGGGGGGVIIIFYFTAGTFTTEEALGGTGGALYSTGSNGANGSAGTIVKVQIA